MARQKVGKMLLRNYPYKSAGHVIYTPGIDWGSELREIRSRWPYAIWHVNGHMGWAGRGLTQYYPTTYILVRKTETHVTSLFEIEPGKRWRIVRAILFDVIEKLAQNNS